MKKRGGVPRRWVRNASDELAASKGFTFSEEYGEKVCEFLETFCRQSKGVWAGKPIEVLEWQRLDFIYPLFGWRRPDGRRRFSSAYCEIPKKNGKSTLISGLSDYFLLVDPLETEEGAPEVYISAVDREQASIVFDEASRMVQASPSLSSRLQVIDSKKRIIDPVGHGKIQACSADVPSKDGVNASHVIFDELHRFKTREMWSIFEYAGATRRQFLRIAITTAGEAEDGIWYEQRLLSEGINNGTIPDLSHLGVIYKAEKDDDLDAPETWKKANPSLGITIDEDKFADEWEQAKASPSPMQRANFLRLRFGIVSGASLDFIDLSAWDKCRGDLRGNWQELPARVGFDLSSIDDLSAVVTLIGDEETGFDIWPRFYLPGDKILELEREHKVPYRQWAEMGLLDLTTGEVIDYDKIESDLIEIALSLEDFRGFYGDPYNAGRVAGNLSEKHGFTVEYITQGFWSMSPPTKELIRLVKARKFRHDGNQIFRWMVGNCKAEKDSAGNIRLSKKKSVRKIDGVVALVNTLAGIVLPGDGDNGPSVYESQGVEFI